MIGWVEPIVCLAVIVIVLRLISRFGCGYTDSDLVCYRLFWISFVVGLRLGLLLIVLDVAYVVVFVCVVFVIVACVAWLLGVLGCVADCLRLLLVDGLRILVWAMVFGCLGRFGIVVVGFGYYWFWRVVCCRLRCGWGCWRGFVASCGWLFAWWCWIDLFDLLFMVVVGCGFSVVVLSFSCGFECCYDLVG